MLRLTHSQHRLDILEQTIDAVDVAAAATVAVGWLQSEHGAHRDLVDHYDTWAVHEATPQGAGPVIATGDASLPAAR